MRFNDLTLDGLMKEFEKKISKAEEGGDTGYTLPQDLLDQPAATADVPYYDEMLKSTAAERGKLYGVVADSKILDEAHPKGSVKLEGLSGDEITVEDLQEMKSQFEKVLSSTVKAKSADLAIKLKKLAKNLTSAGHTELAQQVERQVTKLAEDFTMEMGTPTVTNVPKESMDFQEGDLEAFVANAGQSYKIMLDSMLGSIEYGAFNALSDDMKARWGEVKVQAPDLADMAIKLLQDGKNKEALAWFKELANLFHPYVKATANVPKVAQVLNAYKNAFAALVNMSRGDTSGEHNKLAPHKGMLAAQKLLNQYLAFKKSKGGQAELVQENGLQNDPATWQAIEKHLYLKPGVHFKNYNELLSKMKEQIKNISPTQEHNKVVTPDTMSAESLRSLLQPGAGPTAPVKGPPVAPTLPLSMRDGLPK